MGWLHITGSSRQDLIAKRTQERERATADGIVRSTCLAHCYRGGTFEGVLWTVWERTVTLDAQAVKPAERWIGCDLLCCGECGWGYKSMDEFAHPYYYCCPLEYLEMIPIERYGGNPEWRSIVREHNPEPCQ